MVRSEVWEVNHHASLIAYSSDFFIALFFITKGHNDNPTAQQFEAAYRKLLVHNEVKCSNRSNCIDSGTKILSVSSNRPAKQKPNINEIRSAILFLPEDFEERFESSLYIDDVHSHSLAYMSSVLESKIIKAKSPRLLVKCEQCIYALIENELMDDSFIRFKARKTNITQPCKSVFEICKFVDTFLKSCDDQPGSYHLVLMAILREIPFETLFTSTNFDTHSGEAGHKYDFVKKIVEIFMNMKSVYVAKCLTLKTHDEEQIRHDMRKLVQSKGQ